MGNARKPVPAGGQPTPAAIANSESTPPAGGEGTAENKEDANATETGAEEGTTATSDDADGEHVDACVLVAFDGYQPDNIVSAPAEVIEKLKLSGRVDPHPDAVAYARSLEA